MFENFKLNLYDFWDNFKKNFFKSFFIPLIGLILGWFGSGALNNFLYKDFFLSLASMTIILYFPILIFRSLPKIPKDLLSEGKLLSIDDIPQIPNNIKKVGVIGISNVGKTSFINKFYLKPFAEERTSNISGILHPYPKPNKCFIDLDGTNRSDLFRLLDISDVIILIIDHNSSESITIDSNRMKDHRNLINQVDTFINAYDQHNKKPTILLINKMDLWSRAKNKAVFQNECELIFENWKKIFKGYSEKINFSNLNAPSKESKNHHELLKLIDDMKRKT